MIRKYFYLDKIIFQHLHRVGQRDEHWSHLLYIQGTICHWSFYGFLVGLGEKKSQDEWELKKREAFSFDVLSYHGTIGGMGGMTTFFSVTSTGHIMVISGTVDEGLFAWLWLQWLICWPLLPWVGWLRGRRDHGMWMDYCLLLLSAILFFIQWAGQMRKHFTRDCEMSGLMKLSCLPQVFLIHKPRICFGWVKDYNFIDLWFPWVIACDWLVVTFFPTFFSLIFQLFLVINISSLERLKEVSVIVCTERES